MSPDPTSADSLIAASRQALERGDRSAARHYAEQAAALAPGLEQPWLLLAFLASPKAAQYYVDRALQANPASQQALAAREWLKKQVVQGVPLAGSASPAAPAPVKQSLPGANPRHKRRFPVGWVALVTLGILLAVLAGSLFIKPAALPADNQDATLASVVQTVLKSGPTQPGSLTPSLTPTTVTTETSAPSGTPSPLPSRTASHLPTQTASPPPTATRTPTAQPTATKLPSPARPKNTQVANTTYSVVPGDTLMIIAQRFNIPLQNLIAANTLANPSWIMAGQVLTIPKGGVLPTAAQPTAASSNPTGATSGGKEIQIDISEQHLYAYQDHKLVISLVVSTGIGNSTRIGTFKVLDKIPNAFSNSFNIWMPYWMGIYYSGTLENGIHGLPLLMNGVELWGSLLGKPATYGCIESRTVEIKKLYDWAEIGTTVIIRK